MAGLIQKAAANQAEKAGQPTLQQYIKKMEGEIAKALPSVMTPERFSRIVLSALSSNPKLAKTTPQSFLAAMMNAAQLGLEPNTQLGHAYLIPYQNKGVLECQFQIGYQGMIELARRDGNVTVMQARTVYANDEFTYEYGLNPDLKHVPTRQARGEPIFFYGMFRLKNGGFGFEVMSVEDIRDHAKRYSKSYSNGPWKTNFEEMAQKTVLKRALKYAPMSSEFVLGMAQDETIKREISEDMFSIPTVELEVNEETGEVIDAEFSEVAQEEADHAE